MEPPLPWSPEEAGRYGMGGWGGGEGFGGVGSGLGGSGTGLGLGWGGRGGFVGSRCSMPRLTTDSATELPAASHYWQTPAIASMMERFTGLVSPPSSRSSGAISCVDDHAHHSRRVHRGFGLGQFLRVDPPPLPHAPALAGLHLPVPNPRADPPQGIRIGPRLPRRSQIGRAHV